ncbi:SOS response-associated peptidase [Symbioplanes lichenis]|uniref:SOS response-associated peptidase n=1 Tax=Symbioplanes lichenis TaxID=1629072 RepID=UPI00273881D0|nr:SOS response-associated peptidase [Actinoplanes lichenis]
MCGRYATTKSEADLSRLFDAVPVAEAPAASWNVAPTDPVPVIRVSGTHAARVVDTVRWGLPGHKGAMINARAETVDRLPAFKSSFERRRCLVPADGWYEWVRDGKRKQPFYMTPRDGSVLAFAGLWTRREDTMTCGVITTAALGGLVRVHDRMPLILPPERWDEWLAAESADPGLLRPLTPGDLDTLIEVRPVGAAVGNVRNNGPQLTAPAAEVLEDVLF